MTIRLTDKLIMHYGNLCKYQTNEVLREATEQELISSLTNYPTGAFLDEDTEESVYVDWDHDPLNTLAFPESLIECWVE